MNFFYSIVDQSAPTFVQVLLAILLTIVLAGALAVLYTIFKKKEGYFKDMPISLFIFPIILSITVIVMDAIGRSFTTDATTDIARFSRVGVALLAALLILRIRSQQRDIEDIVLLFFATVLGLVCGMGYVFVALTFFVTVVGVYSILKVSGFPKMPRERMSLKITVPENLDFENAFDDILKKYTTYFSLKKVKTTDLGSLILLSYEILLKKGVNSKEMLDMILPAMWLLERYHHPFYLVYTNTLPGEVVYEDQYQVAVKVGGKLDIKPVPKSWSPKDE